MISFALLLAVIFPLGGYAQEKPAVPSTYVLKKGDSVLALAGKMRYPNATTNQMAYAIIMANVNALGQRTTERWRPGATLKIPDEATVMRTDAKAADQYVAQMLKSDARYREGVALEKSGDMKGAITAYLDSAKIGHPLADLRLGQLYDKDLSNTLPHDLLESIKFYQAARKKGVAVEGPERIGVGEKP